MASILTESVASLEAAGEMQIKLRQLRFHTFLYVMDPKGAKRLERTEEDRQAFESAFKSSEKAASSAERPLLKKIDADYKWYQKALSESGTYPDQLRDRSDFLRWADEHPVQPLLDSCNDLLSAAREQMKRTARESEEVGARTRLVMIILAVIGPLGGLLAGYGIARGLSRTIGQLRVRIQDVHAQLDQDAGAVEIKKPSGPAGLDRQLDRLVIRIREMVALQQQQQREMLRTEQLSAVGQLAASVAHEIRNPLMGMKLLIGAAQCGGADKTLTPDDLQVIHREIIRLEQTVQSLLSFARPSALNKGTADLCPVAEQAMELVRARAQQLGVACEIHGCENRVLANVDSDQIKTVFVNLFLNAIDAMPQGGRLTILFSKQAGGSIRITVTDTGSGIPEHIAGRLFTPFTTTKSTGTGLGLSVCRRVIRDHGGEIVAQNRPEGGASFTMTLPPPTNPG
jgi:signal transduction histidine kinase